MKGQLTMTDPDGNNQTSDVSYSRYFGQLDLLMDSKHQIEEGNYERGEAKLRWDKAEPSHAPTEDTPI